MNKYYYYSYAYKRDDGTVTFGDGRQISTTGMFGVSMALYEAFSRHNTEDIVILAVQEISSEDYEFLKEIYV